MTRDRPTIDRPDHLEATLADDDAGLEAGPGGAALPFRIVESRYVLGRHLGTGGMGIVFEALDRLTGDRVAVKIVRQRSSSPARVAHRFRREFAALSRLDHPHVVRGLGYGVEQGYPYLVLEFVEGEPLSSRLSGGRRLPPDQLIRILSPVIAALGSIHSHGLVHRDVKPSNVMVTPDGLGKLMDLGLIRSIDGDASSQFGGIRGTFLYLSPEQASERPVDGRSDLFSLGVVMYQALTGQLPFSAEEGLLSLLNQIVRRQPRPPRQIDPAISPELERIVMKLLEKDPQLRYQRALELLEDLSRLGGQVPIEAPADEATVYHPALVGRDREIVWIEDYLARRWRGEAPAVALVLGDPGMGKSRLLGTEIRARRLLAGDRFLRVRCSPEDAVPLQPIVALVDAAADRLAAAARGNPAVATVLAGLAPLSRWIERLVPPGTPNPGSVPLELLPQLLEAGYGGRRLVLFVDNLQHVDEATLDWLVGLVDGQEGQGRRRYELPRTVALLASCCTDLGTPPKRVRPLVAALGGDAAGEDGVEGVRAPAILRLSRLGRDEIRAMLSTMFATSEVSEAIVGRVLEESEGVPLVAEEVSRELYDMKALRRQGRRLVETGLLGATRVRSGMVERLKARIAQLDEDERRFAELAAILGPRFDLSALLRMAPEEDVAIFALVVGQLERKIVLRKLPGDTREERWAFVHPGLRQLLLAGITEERRRALHRRAAETLEGGAGPPRAELLGRLAHHYRHAALYGKASHFAGRAAELSMEQGAYADAMHLFELALEDMSRVSDREAALLRRRRTRVIRRLTRLLEELGHLDRAAELLETLERLGREVAVRGIEVEARLRRLQLRWRAGLVAGDDEGEVRRLWDEVEVVGDPAHVVELWATAARWDLAGGRPRAALDRLERARAVLDTATAGSMRRRRRLLALVRCLRELSLAALDATPLPPLLDDPPSDGEGTEEGRSEPPDGLTRRVLVDGALAYAAALLHRGHWRAARELAWRCLTRAHRHGTTAHIIEALDLFALLSRLQGEPALALGSAERARGLAERVGAWDWQARRLALMAEAALDLAQIDRAAALLEEARELVNPESPLGPPVDTWLAEARLAAVTKPAAVLGAHVAVLLDRDALLAPSQRARLAWLMVQRAGEGRPPAAAPRVVHLVDDDQAHVRTAETGSVHESATGPSPYAIAQHLAASLAGGAAAVTRAQRAAPLMARLEGWQAQVERAPRHDVLLFELALAQVARLLGQGRQAETAARRAALEADAGGLALLARLGWLIGLEAALEAAEITVADELSARFDGASTMAPPPQLTLRHQAARMRLALRRGRQAEVIDLASALAEMLTALAESIDTPALRRGFDYGAWSCLVRDALEEAALLLGLDLGGDLLTWPEPRRVLDGDDRTDHHP